MRSVCFVTLLLLLVSPVIAQERIYLDITGLKGDFHLTIANGGATVVPIRVVTLGDQPDPDPKPNNLTSLSGTLAREANDPATSQNLAIALGAVVVTAESGSYSEVAEVVVAANAAIDRVLNTRALQNRWKSWKDGVNAEITKMRQDGDIATVAQCGDAWKQVAKGNWNAAEGAALNILKIIQLVQVIMEVISEDDFSLETILKIVQKVLEIFGARLELPTQHAPVPPNIFVRPFVAS